MSSKSGAAAISVLSNLLLVVAKLVVGFATGSVSVISEAVHSGMDLAAAVIALTAVRVSARPADTGHSYGHGKAENFSGAIEAVLIFAAAAWIIYEAAHRIAAGGGRLESLNLGLVVMGLSVVMNFFVSRNLLKVAARTDSIALEADARHLTTDMATSAGVFIGLLAVQLTGLDWLDPVIAVLIALIIMRTAFDLTRRSVVDLLDQSLPPTERMAIISVINEYSEQVLEFHSMRTRKSGAERYVDLHLVVDRRESLVRAHEICTEIEDRIKARLPGCDVVIHIEPDTELTSADSPPNHSNEAASRSQGGDST